MSERSDESLLLRITLGIVAVFVVLYSLLISQRPLLGLLVVHLLFGAYLLWRFFHLSSRFVRAVERIADSMEAGESR